MAPVWTESRRQRTSRPIEPVREPQEVICGGARWLRRRGGCRGIRPGEQIAETELTVDVLGGLGVAGDERDIRSHDVADRALEERIVRAAEHEGVDAGVPERREVVLGHGEELGRIGDAGLHEVDEPRAGLRRRP